MISIVGALVWYVGPNALLLVLSKTNPFYLLLAFAAYFLINVLFTIRIIRVLEKQGIKATFGKTILAQYAGMLTSDITPGRSGYIITPAYLMNQNIAPSASLSCILGIQSIEFLVKVVGGAAALIFLVNQTHLTHEVFTLAIIGIGLMFLGAFLLAAVVWSPRIAAVVRRIASSRPLSRIANPIMVKLDTFEENAVKTRGVIPEMTFITLLSWITKGFEWYFLGLSIGLGNIGWLGFFLLHPLVTAFGFVPLTPSGIGFQEGAIVGVFLLLGVDVKLALAFAILSRVMLIIEDFIGAPQIAKSARHGLFATSRLMSRRSQ